MDELHEANLAVLEAQMALCVMTARKQTDDKEAEFRIELEPMIRRYLKLMAPHASEQRVEAASRELAWTAMDLRVGRMDRFFVILERDGCAKCCRRR